MAKSKNAKKKGLSDQVRTKKAAGVGKQNPFELKINKQKHDVLGKKLSKYDHGKPTVSRFRAVQKRKETLLVEYRKRTKVNKFVDRRFGETDPEISLEDKMLQRFALERQRGHDKQSKYNLNDEDDLTHFGQSLSEIERFDEPIDDEDDDERGVLDSDLVTEEHFGGFLTKKKDDGDQSAKSWKERMEEIIAKSKKQKHERQSEKDKTLELTNKVDEEWKTLMNTMVTTKRNKDSVPQAPKSDDYDVTVRQLQFDIRGKATDRLKSEEEIAKEERERLEKLEADRVRRMNGLSEEEDALQKSVYRSADDLDDGFDFGKSAQFEAAYKDGKLIRNFDADEAKEDEGDGESDEEDSGDEGDESDSEDESGSGSESEDAMKQTSDLESDSESDNESEEEGSDREEQESDGEEEQDTSMTKKQQAKYKGVTEKDIQERLKETEAMMEEARNEIPYTFPAPSSYEELVQLFEGRSEEQQILLIERTQKLYHPSLSEGNKEKLQTFYELLLQYFCDLGLQDPPMTSLMDRMVKPLYQLTQLFPQTAGAVWTKLLMQKQKELSERRVTRGYPTLDVLCLLKLVAALFPTSDFSHAVVTPAMLLMGQILSECAVVSPRDVLSGLFLCGVCLQYVVLSKRLVPEAINFLCGVLSMAANKPEKKVTVPPPFKSRGKQTDLLRLSEKAERISPEPLEMNRVFSSKGLSSLPLQKFKVCAIHQSLALVQKYTELYQNLPSFVEIFSPLHVFIASLPLQKLPEKTRNLHKTVTDDFKHLAQSSVKVSLVRPKTRPKPLKTFEPKFDEVFEVRKKRVGSRETQERQRLIHNHKKEMKGAIRNLRQDNSFLAREKLKERMERDAERKRKVKELFADLATQEGDFKALERKKNKL